MHHHHPLIQSSCGACCTSIEKLAVSYGSTVVLEDINLHFHCGEMTAIVGPNGAGKTTLLRALLKQVPYSGSIHFRDGENKKTDAPIIGYVPQRLEFDPSTPMSVEDLFAVVLSSRPIFFKPGLKVKQQALESLKTVDALHLIDKSIGEMSGGELQRVLLALSITPVPHLLFLDEPITGLDVKGMELFYQTVSRLREKYDLSIVVISHDLSLVSKVADRMIVLNKKIIASGSPAIVLADEKVQDMFGISALAVAVAHLRSQGVAGGRE